MYFTQLLEAVHWIQWRPVFTLTLSLMAFYTIFFQENKPDGGRTESVLAPSPRKPQPNSLLLPDILDDTDPLLVEGPEDRMFPPDAAPNPYIAVCMAVKNQAPDLGEFFVHHYHHIGIQRFYIMDDDSDPPLSTFEYPGVPRSALSFIVPDLTDRVSEFAQIEYYGRCIADYGHLHTWMAFIDGHEYFETPSNDTLRDILEEFEGNETIGALAVNWRMHSPSGLLPRPISTRKGFVTCITDELDKAGKPSDNRQVKVIVRTSSALSPKGPHMWHLKVGHTVGENGDIVDSEEWRQPITRDRIGLHHYAVKSKQEYEENEHRGNAEGEHVDCPEMAQYDP